MSTMITRYKAARRVGTPLIAISTADQPATVIDLIRATAAKVPVVTWDIVRGWLPGNDPGQAAIGEALEGADPAAVTIDPVESLVAASKLPSKSILICYNAHRMVGPDDRSRGAQQTIQAVANLRDLYKRDLRSLVMLGPSFVLAPEVAPDVLLLDEPLPSERQLAEIVTGAAGQLKGEALERAVDALRGLAAFPAEQAAFMSLKDGELDLDELWSRKRAMIGATPGLSVWQGRERFEDVGGNEQVKQFLRRVLAGRNAPRTVVFIDEIEKALAGATGPGDSSGVSQGQLEILLREMQDNNWCGTIFIGPPGAGKSAVAKAIGGEGGIPTVALDLNGMKASLVGQSEERLRTAMKVIKAVGGEQVLVVATCNKINTLPPELRRRFTLGTFFFDLPDRQEREAIWRVWQAKYPAAASPDADYVIIPNDEGWTGAEIKQCCENAWRFGVTYDEAAAYVVPVSKAAAAEIEQLRRTADGRFLSASKPGAYQVPRATAADSLPGQPRRERATSTQEV